MSVPIFIPRVDSVCDVLVRCLVFEKGVCAVRGFMCRQSVCVMMLCWRSMFRLSFWSCCGFFVLSFVMVVAWRWFPASVLRSLAGQGFLCFPAHWW
jgi:hypothetical protein